MKTFRFALLGLLGLQICGHGRADDAEMLARPTFEQVDISLSKKEFSPALALLRRFPQSDRDKKWDKLLERAAIGHVQTLFRETPAGITETGSRLRKEFPQLRKSADFSYLHTHLATEDLRLCVNYKIDGYECAEKLFQALKDTEEEPAFYLKAAGLVSGVVSVAAAMPFLKMAEDHIGSRKGCASPESQGLLVLGLQLPAGPSRKIAQVLATSRCAPVMTPLLKNARANGNPHFKESLCEISMCPKR